MRQYRARAATGIVMDPRTGAVLAMASAPGYNNNGVHDLPTKAFPAADGQLRGSGRVRTRVGDEGGDVLGRHCRNHIISPGTRL